MIRLVLFYTILLGSVAYAGRRGGRPERWMAALFVVAAAASHAIVLAHGSSYVELDVLRLAVDTLLLGGMAIIMARADRFWPIYCMSFQILAVATHGVRVFDPLVLPPIYYRATAWLAYPTLIILVAGVYRHRTRETIHGEEPSWTADRHADRRREPVGYRNGETHVEHPSRSDRSWDDSAE